MIVNNLDSLCEDVRSKASLARFQALMLELVDITKLSCMYNLPKLVDITDIVANIFSLENCSSSR